MLLMAPLSVGELLDKMTILEIKKERIHDPEKSANIIRELTELQKTRQNAFLNEENLLPLVAELKKINEALWEIEDQIREKEAQKDFADTFITLARSVYQTNDKRAALKKEINLLSGSALIEEKSYYEAH